MPESFEVDESAARKMLHAMGFPSAGEIPTHRVTAHLNRLAMIAPEATTPTGDDLLLFQGVCSALERGLTISLAMPPRNAAETILGALESEPEPPPKVPKPKKPRTQNDKYGMRQGTRGAKINSVIGKKWKSVRQIVAESGVSGPIYTHMTRLIVRGAVEKNEDGLYRENPVYKEGKESGDGG